MLNVKMAIPAVVFGFLATTSVVGAATFNTTGVYDSTNNANFVDRVGAGNLGTFTTSVAAAFTANQGGVIDFDGAGTLSNDPGAINARFGSSLSKTLAITTNAYNIQFSSNIIAISGTENSGTGLFLFANPAVATQTFTFGSIAGGSAGEAVTEAGLTILTRNGGDGTANITVTATFSNGTTQSSVPLTFPSSTGRDNDTFYGFTAPTGTSISSIAVGYGTAGDFRRGVDDFGFITSAVTQVPEPASIGMLAIAGLAALRRRRQA